MCPNRAPHECQGINANKPSEQSLAKVSLIQVIWKVKAGHHVLVIPLGQLTVKEREAVLAMDMTEGQ